MSTQMVRIRKKDHGVLKELAASTGESMSDILAKALDQYRRTYFLEGLADDFAAHRANESDWTDELGERELWASAVTDDLEESCTMLRSSCGEDSSRAQISFRTRR